MKILILSFFALLGCEKNDSLSPSIDKQFFIGIWVNTQNNADTLFWNDSIILRSDSLTALPKHKYLYALFEDSLQIKYKGEYYISVPSSNHKLNINNDKSVISIEDLEHYFPEYKGNTFLKITK